MPWKETCVMDQRIEFVLKASQPQANLSALCREFGISRRIGYKWLERYRKAGTVTALAERSRRPHRSPSRTPVPLEEQVVALRQEYGWGGRKLSVLLARQGVHLPEITVNRILKRRGLVTSDRRQQSASRRFCREACNQLWQMDFKGEYGVSEGEVYPLVVLDDHSRYLLGLWPLPRPKGHLTKAVLEPLFTEIGLPQAMLMDHGIPWWSNSNYFGLTTLSVWIMRQGTRLCFGGIRHPQTQGKVERQNRSLKERTLRAGVPRTASDWDNWASRYRQEYNQIRPHEALAMRTPAQVWQPVNLRPYQAQPPAWDYGGAKIARVDRLGMISWKRRRCFVCEALVGERVRVDELDDTLLVTFCNTTLREIDLRTGRSRPVTLDPNFDQKCIPCHDR